MDHEEWTAGQETASVTVDGHELSMAFREFPGGDGPPVVFLHGIPTWSYLWHEIAPALGEDRHVVVPDLVGYGNSAMRDGFDRSIRAQEQALADLIEDHLDADRVVLVAHDIGGGVALRYAAHEPDRVAGLVLSNAVCYDSWPVEFISDLGLPETAERSPEEIETHVGGAFEAGVYDEADPEFVEGMVAPWVSDGGPTALARAAVATNTNHTTEIDYGAIETELLCLWGGADSFQPIEYGHRLAEDLGGEVVELEAYHWVTADRPEEYVTRLREFVTESIG